MSPDDSARVERDQAPVDPGADAGVADLGVDGVGEVDRRGVDRQRDDLALRGEDEDLVLLEVDLQPLHELVGVAGLGLPVDDAVEPGHVDRVRVAVLVGPVGGDALLGPAVHLPRADLHLDRLALRPDHRRVQRLVEVELGHGDVVLEPALDRLPRGVDRPQRRVAVLHRLDDDPHAHQVEDVVELAALHDHLLVDRVEVLRPPGDLGGDAQLGQALAHLLEHLGEVDVALGRADRRHVVDLGVPLGVQGGEGQILELGLHVLHAEAVGQRGVDVEGLAGDAVLLPRRHRRDGAHVVEAVRELDDQDPQVAGHGHQHLAHGGGLLGLAGVELDPLELGDAVDDGGDVDPERALDLVERRARVLDGVVQQRGGDGDVVEAEVGDDAGHGQGVLDVRLARVARLAAVRVGGLQVGPRDEGRRRLGVTLAEGGEKGRDLVSRRRVVATPRKDPVDGRHAYLLSRAVLTQSERRPGVPCSRVLRRCATDYTVIRLSMS